MKYEILWNISKEINGVKVYRIRALKDFSNVKAGDLGGYVVYPHNLSQNGDCWIYDDAQVYGNAKVYDNAKVCDRAELFVNAQVYGNAKVCDRAELFGNAKVYGNAKVCGRAEVHGEAEVYGRAKIYGRAEIYDRAKIFGRAEVCGKAELFGSAEMQSGRIRKIKSNKITAVFEGQCRAVIATLNKGKIEVEVGCFYGDLQEFEKRIYKDGDYRSYDELPPHRKEYLEFIKELKTKEKWRKLLK